MSLGMNNISAQNRCDIKIINLQAHLRAYIIAMGRVLNIIKIDRISKYIFDKFFVNIF